MMSAAKHDFGPLRSSIRTQFNAMSRGVQTNTDIAIVVDQLIEVATRAVLDCVAFWNKQFATIRLPDALLAACFAFLPFRDRFTAGQVSRAWRCVSLSFPFVWSQIELLSRSRDFASLLDVCLARTGCIPIDLECRWLQFWYIGETSIPVNDAVNRHGHRLRSFSWYMFQPLPEFLSSAVPAPLLESLDTDEDLLLSHEFLGGKPSSLRSLKVGVLFPPASCPALSTLTVLNCGIPERPDASWRHLFDLCPRLEALTLRGLPAIMLNLLPNVPAPPSLVELRLLGALCDLAGLYIRWRTDRLTDVELRVHYPAVLLTDHHPRVVQLCAEAVHLEISACAGKYEAGSLTLHAAAPVSAQCVITLGRSYEDHVGSFETVIRVLSLDTVRSLVVDGVLLAVLLERPPPLHLISRI